MATTTQKSGLTFKHKVGYAMGDLGGCMTFALMGAMVTRYYTNVLQVNTAVLATLLMVLAPLVSRALQASPMEHAAMAGMDHAAMGHGPARVL